MREVYARCSIRSTGGWTMHVTPLTAAALVLLVSGPAAAQGWIEYTSKNDLFIVNFPREPAVTEITYPTEFGITLPGRVYGVDDRGSRYSVTVVDYSTVDEVHAERVRGCQGYPDTCTNHAPNELRGALDYAVSNFLERDARITYYGYADTDRIEGRRVQLLNPDQSRTFAAVYMHDSRLY